MKKRLLQLAMGLAIVMVAGMFAVQLVPGPIPHNPPVVASRTLESNTQMPPHISAMMNRACKDCHSNETRWPWYSYLAPMRWRVVKDVEKARKVMNFSEWAVQAGRKPELAAGMLAAACSDAQMKRMPQFGYVLFHNEAEMNQEDVRQFCEWTASEGRRLIAIKRRGGMKPGMP